MKAKALEVRDSMTFIPVVAIDMNAQFDDQVYLLRRAGYVCDGRPIILLTRMDGGKAHYDPFDWGDRTFQVAHQYIVAHWDTLVDGAVVDVEFILEETPSPKLSERHTNWWL
jgi:hypothetical protein